MLDTRNPIDRLPPEAKTEPSPSPQTGSVRAASKVAKSDTATDSDAELASVTPAPAQVTVAATEQPASATVATPATAAVSFPTRPIPTTASVATPAPSLPDAPGGAGAIGGAVFALLLVVGLILALAWLAKRMPGVAGSTNAALRVVGSLSIGPRERVVVVAVGDTQLLLGVGPGGTRTLHTLSAPLPVDDSAPSPFANLLAQHFGKKA